MRTARVHGFIPHSRRPRVATTLCGRRLPVRRHMTTYAPDVTCLRCLQIVQARYRLIAASLRVPRWTAAQKRMFREEWRRRLPAAFTTRGRR
jgi:hypothetical protein